MPNEEWYDLLSVMETKYTIKRAAPKIKKLLAIEEAPANYDKDTSARVLSKNKAMNGVLPARNQQVKKTPNNSVAQSYFLLRKKDGMPDCTW